MANNNVPITPPRVPLVDERTNQVSAAWYRFFFSLYTITGSGTGILPVTSGGTGLDTIPINGQLLIGNGSGYTLNTLTPGQNIAIVNTAGAISVSFSGILAVVNGGTGADNASDARTNLGATTVGSNMFTLTDPSAITFPRFNVDNTVSALNASDFRTAIGAGTVTSVAALTLGTTGTDLSSTVANSTTTPVITLNVPTASATNRGALSAADWTAFNSKPSLSAPVTKTANFTIASTEVWLINNKSGSGCVVTLPAPSTNVGRVLYFQNYQTQTLVSASSNVVPIAGGAATTAILDAVAGNTATIVSDGTNWVMTQSVPNNVLLLE